MYAKRICSLQNVSTFCFSKSVLSIVICSVVLQLSAQQKAAYWVRFTDKANATFTCNHPSQFLSQRAINRRIKNNVAITENDLPVSKVYIDSIAKTGARVMYSSKWFNAATIEVSNDSIISHIKQMSFVASVEKTRDSSSTKQFKKYTKNDLTISVNEPQIDSSIYGKSYTQIRLLNGQYLHKNGFRGNGVLIALLDGGFKQATQYSGLAATWNEGRIIGTHDFVNPGASVFNDVMHGAAVLSTIASSLQDSLVGTAPEASFLLLRSEDANSESLVECDNWIAAAEMADSAGADIISSSLGYTLFDDSSVNFIYGSVNENTARIATAAQMASEKGMVVLVSAGNEGNSAYHYIGEPANAKNILAVGAVTNTGAKADFSSFGPSSDGRVKPDVMAMGQQVVAELSPGVISTLSGTSLSCPITAGLVACLLQAYPNASAQTIRQAVLQSSSQYLSPDSAMGYGIPDFKKAYNILSQASTLYNAPAYAYPNPFSSSIVVVNQLGFDNIITVECYGVTGEKIFSVTKYGGFTELQDEVSGLPRGLYFFRCIGKSETVTIVALKIPN